MSRPIRSSILLIWALVALLGSFASGTPQAQAATLQTSAAAPVRAINLSSATQQCDPEKDLSGTFVANDQGKFKNASHNCTYDVGMASYRKFDNVIDNQKIFDWKTTKIKPGQTITLQIKLPSCATQVDMFHGSVLMSLDGKRYGT